MDTLIIFIVILFILLFPTLIAEKRNHREILGIFVLNFFLGFAPFMYFIHTTIGSWKTMVFKVGDNSNLLFAGGLMFIFWVISLVWALASDTGKKETTPQ